jgi:hypothetical protein
VLACDSSCDGEAESAAGEFGIEPDKALEDQLALGLGNARPAVGDLGLDVTVVPSDLDVDAALRGDRRE